MKNSTPARLGCLLLALLMLMCVVVACAEPGNDTPDTTPTAGDSNTPDSGNSGNNGDTDQPAEEVTTKYTDDTVPEGLNFGKTITLLYWSDQEHEEFETEATNGDRVNDAIYSRNLTVEERLGITLAFLSTPGNYSNMNNWVSHINNSLQAGGGEFDVFASYSLSTAATASKGMCYNLLDEGCSYLNFDQPWWPDRLLNEATINNKLYFASGDISANALYMMYVCFVNNDILEDMSLPQVYELVQSNEWTYDKFLSMCENVYIDLNADGIKNDGDRFGYMSYGMHVDPWFYGSGALIIDKDASGNLQLSDTYAGEKVIKTLETLTNAFYNTKDVTLGGSYAVCQEQFNDGNVLFLTERCRASIRDFDNDELDFSIAPFPKYEASQDSYVTIMGNPFTLYALPIDSSDDELPMLSAFLEVYASESYRQVTPELFDVSLKYRYTNDPHASEMYDLVRTNLSFDLGRIFSSVLVGQEDFRNTVAQNAANTWASKSKAIKKQLPALLNKLISAYDD